MSDSSSETRREILVTAAALAMTAMATSAAADEKADSEKPAAKRGDFDFLAGEWKF